MLCHRQIIQRLGGYIKLAHTLGLDDETVRSWLKPSRGIPARHWHRVARLANVTAADLAQSSPKFGDRHCVAAE